MFRYIGIAWDKADPMNSALARKFSIDLHSRPDWSAAFQRPGLQVFTAGAIQGVNGIYPLMRDEGVVIGRLFRRRDLQASLAGDVRLANGETARIVDGGGYDLVRDFWGRYVAFIRTPSGATDVLRDPSGTLPCFVIQQEGVSVFSWLEDALALLSRFRALVVNWDALAAHVLLGDLGGRETALDGVSQVLPGEIARLRRGNERPELLWKAIDFAKSPAMHSFSEATDLLRETVQSCARVWASCYENILLRLSGGIDSSILTSCLERNRAPTDVVCVNYIGDRRGYPKSYPLPHPGYDRTAVH